ncbi:hypothetical protein [Staphylococcus chromogenes]|uniref:hypothetical protein n=1 Tax=Staphylococcus chromogenes TaxID=46126 RepID=UPI0010ABF727|nr:hypothetical protein [Staphylococcus chromogenes]TJY16647.1 hypothetical protein FCF12_03975 [Staphylococcus chromogenes]
MKEAQLKVLELLEAHKISVDSAALLLDVMSPAQHTNKSHEATSKEEHKHQKESSQSKEAQSSTYAETASSVEDFVNTALKQVSSTLRKSSEKSSSQNGGNKTNPIETFSQIEKSLRDVSEKLNKYNK